MSQNRPSPLARLWHHARPHRTRLVWATIFTVLNKLFDVLPELIIGAAVDVVVRGSDSLVGQMYFPPAFDGGTKPQGIRIRYPRPARDSIRSARPRCESFARRRRTYALTYSCSV